MYGHEPAEKEVEDAVSLAHRLLVLAKLAATTLAALAATAKAVGLI